MRRPRNLSAEERALWEQVAERAEPLAKRSAQAPDSTEPQTPIKTPKNPAEPSLKPSFRVGQKVDHHRDHDLMAGLSEQLAASPVQMDHKHYKRLKRGKVSPESRIDLHGMTLAQAHPALIGFILRAHQNGNRLVLVITGKGKSRDTGGPIPTRLGVLRHQVPQWLSMAPLSQLVMQVTEAHVSHGGHGAYYVYLRRNRA